MKVSVGDSHRHKMMPPRAKAAIPMRLESNDKPVISRNHTKLLRFTPSKSLNTKDRKKPNSNPMVRNEDTLETHSLIMPMFCPSVL